MMVWKIIYQNIYFHIREILSHLRECRSQAPFPGGSQMIREGSHVWCQEGIVMTSFAFFNKKKINHFENEYSYKIQK